MGSLASAVPFTPADTAAQPTVTNGHRPDVTFKNFNAAQAQNYRTARSTYPPALFDYILAFHTTTPIVGNGDRALDVGCGPGNVTVDLAQRFDHVMGVDHSAGMVETANKTGVVTRAGEKVEFRVCGAEDIDKLEGVPPGSVDLITTGTAAHWFAMPKFWEAAAKILKPGGTVAIFSYTKGWLHPSTPNRDAIQAKMDEFLDDKLGEHSVPGRITVRNAYRDLALPWSPGMPPAVSAAFDEASHVYKLWDADGIPESGDRFFGRNMELTLPMTEAYIMTMSSAVRWREAHPELVDTDQDIIKVMVKKIVELLDVPEAELLTYKVRMGTSMVAILVKRTAV